MIFLFKASSNISINSVFFLLGVYIKEVRLTNLEDTEVVQRDISFFLQEIDSFLTMHNSEINLKIQKILNTAHKIAHYKNTELFDIYFESNDLAMNENDDNFSSSSDCSINLAKKTKILTLSPIKNINEYRRRKISDLSIDSGCKSHSFSDIAISLLHDSSESIFLHHLYSELHKFIVDYADFKKLSPTESEILFHNQIIEKMKYAFFSYLEIEKEYDEANLLKSVKCSKSSMYKFIDFMKGRIDMFVKFQKSDILYKRDLYSGIMEKICCCYENICRLEGTDEDVDFLFENIFSLMILDWNDIKRDEIE